VSFIVVGQDDWVLVQPGGEVVSTLVLLTKLRETAGRSCGDGRTVRVQARRLTMTVAYRAAREIDGVSEHPAEDVAVIVEGGRIARVGPTRDLPSGTEGVDLGVVLDAEQDLRSLA
jgi:hypothetical protein